MNAAELPRDVLRDAIALYVDLHAHPELSGAEVRTAGVLAARLEQDGCTVTRRVGGHGVVGVFRNGPGPTVMVRAELDALPVRERTGLKYASTVPGVMHACGHDLHTAAAAGAVSLLAASRDSWRGTLVLVGQPAEETLSGARAMLDDGLYDRFGTPDAVLAQHCAPLPAGSVAHGRGPLMSAGVTLDVVVHGRGGHAGTPHLAVDPVVTAAAVVMRLQTVVSRESAPGERVVLTVGSLHAGDRANVIPSEARLSVSVRAFTDAALTRVTEAVRRVVRAECAASGCDREPEITVAAASPMLEAHPETARRVRRAHQDAFGTHRVTGWPGSTATEDFPHYAAGGVPVAYWMLGATGARQWRAARAGGEPVPANHTDTFAPDVRTALPAGVTAMATAARSLLGAPGHRAAAP
ncbi:amidohydrolase [Streptomyces sp. ICN441]|uniref:Amidohydrolase n=1 Tax=Streptomyces tirandamycinicus TaxID=2174846 RepID=A0A2S1T101_9ACTN|nr:MULTISPECIES: amidohydrolase [Streptomyces]AWI32330.1 amidohydrolase [Streptomyces tirandamycinicus]TFE47644.1 amidohydrolase [Streptomyces sp. ICN441]